MRLKLFKEYLNESVWNSDKDSIREILQDIIDENECEVILTEADEFKDIYQQSSDRILKNPPKSLNPKFVRIDIICNDDSARIKGKKSQYRVQSANLLSAIREEMAMKLLQCEFKVHTAKNNKDAHVYDIYTYGSSVEIFGRFADKISTNIIIKK